MNHRSVQFGGGTYDTVYSYLTDGRANTTTYPSTATVTQGYDTLNRPNTTDITPTSTQPTLRRETSYLGAGGTRTTSLISAVNNYVRSNSVNTPVAGWTRFGYTYDTGGNIASVTETNQANATRTTTYEYDRLNQLTRVNDPATNLTTTYTYDNAGNILTRTEYPYTTSTPGTASSTVGYTYGDSVWKDKLTAYKGQPITYDGAGNPLSYRDGMSFTWQQGRQLATTTTSAGQQVSYTYNPQGNRISKTSGGVTTTYLVDEQGVIQATQQGSDKLVFLYDSTGRRDGFMWWTGTTFNGTYYYLYNLQSDVTGIVNNTLTPQVMYEYDAWGKPTKTTDGAGVTITPTARHLANINPFRYRSYTYDQETGLYHLNSRYYDPVTGRFINADTTNVLGNSDVVGSNLFAYCGNNPISEYDPSGYKAIDITARLTSLMRTSAWQFAMYLYSEVTRRGSKGLANAFLTFYRNAKNYGAWDLKRQKAWQPAKGDWFVFRGQTLRSDDPGNILFGYVGSVMFPVAVLHAGAGIYHLQIGKATGTFRTWFDDPRDYAMIEYGHSLFMRDLGKLICRLLRKC